MPPSALSIIHFVSYLRHRRLESKEIKEKRCVTIWNASLRDKNLPAVNSSVRHQPLDVCLFPHHLRLSPWVRGCIFLHMTSRFFFCMWATLLSPCWIALKKTGEWDSGEQGGQREWDGKRETLSSPDGGWIQSALAWGGSRGSVQPSCEFAFRLQQAPASASSDCCTLLLQGFSVLFFFSFLLRRRLITAQSDARLRVDVRYYVDQLRAELAVLGKKNW